MAEGRHPGPGSAPTQECTPLEQEVLEEYATLLSNLNSVRQLPIAQLPYFLHECLCLNYPVLDVMESRVQKLILCFQQSAVQCTILACRTTHG